MKKKLLIIIATTLIALLLLPPIAYAGVVHFWWDNVYFVAGTDIDYPHPDNAYYGISSSSDWTRLGNNLYHNQINRDTSYAICIGITIFIDIVALILGAKLGGSSTAYYVAGLATIVISTAITMALDYFFVDERGCIWWWISWLFLYYLYKNLPYLSGLYKEKALAEILAAFLCFGYFRVGMVTFHDPMGIGPPAYTLSISATSGGTTNPSPGTYTYGSGSSVTVTAKPNSGYQFWYWVVDGDTTNYTPEENPITITMDQDHTLEAHFYYKSMCPTLFVWNGTDYAEEGALDIHADSDVTVQHEIQNTLALTLDDGVYKLQLRELDNFTSHIDQVKLLAVYDSGETITCPLINAKHSEDGNVLTELLWSDDVRTNTEPNECIGLKFQAPTGEIEIDHFIFVIEGYNMK